MATGTYTPDPFIQFEDSSGNPLATGKLYTYIAGTSTPLATYSDVNLTVQNANPIILGSDGRNPAGPIFLTPGQSYKYVLQDLNGNTISTRDNISAVPPSSANIDVQGTAGQGISAGQVVYLSSGDGGKTPGLWYLADTGNLYSSASRWVGIAPNAIAQAATGTIRLGGYITGLSGLVTGSLYYVGVNGALTTSPAAFSRIIGQADTAASLVLQGDPPTVNQYIQAPTITSPTIQATIISGSALLAGVCQGRLTLTSGQAVTSADVIGATTLYLTPYGGNNIGLFDGSANWTVLPFAETSIPLSTLSNALPYDVFGFNSGGNLALEFQAWANGTARAVALISQNGIFCKSGATTRRYLGTFYTTATTTTEDSAANRYLWNYYNRFNRQLLKQSPDPNWSVSLATIRQANNNTANQVNVVIGYPEELVEVHVESTAITGGATSNLAAGIGIDSTTTFTGDVAILSVTNLAPVLFHGFYMGVPTIGNHSYTWNESNVSGGGTITINNTISPYSTPGLYGITKQ